MVLSRAYRQQLLNIADSEKMTNEQKRLYLLANQDKDALLLNMVSFSNPKKAKSNSSKSASQTFVYDNLELEPIIPES